MDGYFIGGYFVVVGIKNTELGPYVHFGLKTCLCYIIDLRTKHTAEKHIRLLFFEKIQEKAKKKHSPQVCKYTFVCIK